MADILDRFLRYVTYDTQSDERSPTYPSTGAQLVLLRDLVAESRTLGLADASIDEHGYVVATIPSTSTKPGVSNDWVHRASRHVDGAERRQY